MTASVGIVLFPAHGRRLEDLIGLAEGAMFDVVLAGGNGCRVAAAPPGDMAPDGAIVVGDWGTGTIYRIAAAG